MLYSFPVKVCAPFQLINIQFKDILSRIAADFFQFGNYPCFDFICKLLQFDIFLILVKVPVNINLISGQATRQFYIQPAFSNCQRNLVRTQENLSGFVFKV
jgi:hypothetical protein